MISTTARLISRNIARTSALPRAFAAQGPTRSMAALGDNFNKKVSCVTRPGVWAPNESFIFVAVQSLYYIANKFFYFGDMPILIKYAILAIPNAPFN